jgi:ADP-heptose:LPS heptosyltransferase
LRELLVLYTLADTLVTNDSGPGHFASMTDIHSIVLYGPETPGLFGAIGGRSHIIHAGLACSPCVNVFNHRFSPCKNNLCMQSISVEEVYQAVHASLQG